MSMEAASTSIRLSRFEQLRFGREVIRQEGDALVSLASGLHDEFCDAIDLLFACQGSVIVTGMGKAGLIGQKITATLASTGTNAHFLHPAEAIHGDLGRIHQDDIVLALSFSGETEEVVRLLPSLEQFGTPTIAITRNTGSTLGRTATVTIALGPLSEACSLGLAPSTSTTAMLAVGDAQGLVNLPPSYAPGPASNYPPNPSFSGASAKPAPAPAAPAKKRSFGLILFFVALLLVVVLSALGGFALRAHMRGELELPGSHE